MTFHSYRNGHAQHRSLSWMDRLWSWHDRHPLPPALNHFVRERLLGPWRRHSARRAIRRELACIRRTGKDSFGDPLAPDHRLCPPQTKATLPPMEEAAALFGRIHQANEHLRNADGSWSPQRHANYYQKGISIEEVALRICGYLDAHHATGEPIYSDRALSAGAYLVDRRCFKDGHLLLEGHTVIDTTYAFAIDALLKLWRATKDERYLQTALPIGDRLLEFQVAGSINHAAIPAQVFGPLYQITGDSRYLAAAWRRLQGAVLPAQLPYGGWTAHESLSWYHAITTKSLIRTYRATPFTMAYQQGKDELAHAILRALNRLILAQEAGGRIPPGRGDSPYAERDEYGSFPPDQFTTFAPSEGFKPAPQKNLEFYCLELDVLIEAAEELSLPQLHPVIAGLLRHYSSRNLHWRPEFDTFAIGRYLRFRAELDRLNLQDRVRA